MRDTKFKSITEGLANIAVGWPINHLANMLILIPFTPHLKDTVERTGIFSGDTQLILAAMGAAYTVVSYVRQYTLRRLFNRLGHDENAYTLFVRLFEAVKYRVARK